MRQRQVAPAEAAQGTAPEEGFFGKAFVCAHEEQLERLRSRKKKL